METCNIDLRMRAAALEKHNATLQATLLSVSEEKQSLDAELRVQNGEIERLRAEHRRATDCVKDLSQKMMHGYVCCAKCRRHRCYAEGRITDSKWYCVDCCPPTVNGYEDKLGIVRTQLAKLTKTHDALMKQYKELVGIKASEIRKTIGEVIEKYGVGHIIAKIGSAIDTLTDGMRAAMPESAQENVSLDTPDECECCGRPMDDGEVRMFVRKPGDAEFIEVEPSGEYANLDEDNVIMFRRRKDG
ncbi:MAG: hypothetical protein AMS21_01020 [Gemmatimonas sp. SG8_38_2]|nr:MAG: hypothetical protein AMS21_01020 [Gemmatimonas sp. SG8_38_2]